MDTTIIYLALVLVGLCLGSFAGASVWRLRARQLVEDKADHQDYDKLQYKRLVPLTGSSIAKDRSRCLDCGYGLHWYDLVPLVSWLSLWGRCRQCRKPIGWFEPLMELGVAGFFVLSYAFWPYQLQTMLEIAQFVIWLIAGVGLAILFAYDTKWFLLPDKVNYIIIGLGLVSATLVVLQSSQPSNAVYSIAGAVLILSGLYLALYYISQGRWIGFGDVKLGLGLGLLLADWRLAFVALFAANLIGCLIVIPAMMAGKLKRDSQVPFGPLLILGFVVAQLAGYYLIGTYFTTLI